MKRYPRIDYNAPFCLGFSLACIVVLIAGFLSNGWLLSHVFSMPGSASLAEAATYPRLLLHVLGHANPQHLFANLMLLLLIGPMLEKAYGAVFLTAVTVATAVLTGLIMMLFFSGSLLGASGVVFAFIVLSSFANARSGTIPLTFILVSFIFIGGEILRAFEGDGQIAYFAHIAGGAVGAVAGFMRRS